MIKKLQRVKFRRAALSQFDVSGTDFIIHREPQKCTTVVFRITLANVDPF